jgi:hypothetical protein
MTTRCFTKQLKNMYDVIIENGNDFLEIIEELENESDKNDVANYHRAYMEITELAKKIHKRKNMGNIGFLLVFILHAIHMGPEEVDNLLKLFIEYFGDICQDDEIHLYDENGGKITLEELGITE